MFVFILEGACGRSEVMLEEHEAVDGLDEFIPEPSLGDLSHQASLSTQELYLAHVPGSKDCLPLQPLHKGCRLPHFWESSPYLAWCSHCRRAQWCPPNAALPLGLHGFCLSSGCSAPQLRWSLPCPLYSSDTS